MMENKDILYKLYRLLNRMAITHPLPPLERGTGYHRMLKKKLVMRREEVFSC